MTREVDAEDKFEEIPITPKNFPEVDYIMKMLKNKIYVIPKSIMPPLKPYEVEVTFFFFVSFSF